MNAHARATYNGAVGSVRRGARLLFLAFVMTTSSAPALQAQPVLIQVAVAPNPVLWVQLRSGHLTVRTWDRPSVQIEADANVQWHHFNANEIAARVPAQVMMWSQTIRGPAGDMTLPAEAFIIPTLQGSDHDAVVARGDGNAVITVPSTTALVVTNVSEGAISIQNYRGGVFIAHVRAGQVELMNVEGTGAVQVVNGPVDARNSDFNRLRVRTARGNMVFENCSSRQIEATSLMGSILYDNGLFQPGLARFESQRGDVALGVAGGGVQIGAHSSAGQIYSGFEGREASIQRQLNDAQATVNGGGPFITATSGTGSVIFYKGALRNHPRLQQRFPRGRGFGRLPMQRPG